MWTTLKNTFLNPILKLNKYPVLYHGKNFYIVGFGIFSAVAAFIAMSFFVAYMTSKDIKLYYPLAIWLPLGALATIIFSKLFHILVVGKEFFQSPLKYLKQTAFYNQGGQIGVLVTALILSYFENISVWIILDALCFSYCAAMIIGRIGCYNYGCCYGRITGSKFSVTYTNKESKVLRLHPELRNKRLIPTQLLCASFDFLLFIALIIIYVFEPRAGLLTLIFVTVYNGFRIAIQHFRGDETEPKKIFLITSYIFTIMGLIGLIVIFFFYDFLPSSPTVTPLSFGMYFNTLLSDPWYFVTLLAVSFICVFVYGFHHRKLGQHL